MNKIFSKVWNKELGQLVVASELASSDSTCAAGNCGVSRPQRHALVLAMMLVFAVKPSAYVPLKLASVGDRPKNTP